MIFRNPSRVCRSFWLLPVWWQLRSVDSQDCYKEWKAWKIEFFMLGKFVQRHKFAHSALPNYTWYILHQKKGSVKTQIWRFCFKWDPRKSQVFRFAARCMTPCTSPTIRFLSPCSSFCSYWTFPLFTFWLKESKCKLFQKWWKAGTTSCFSWSRRASKTLKNRYFSPNSEKISS